MKSNPTLHVTIGAAGSGKSTFARNMVANSNDQLRIINRDKIRELIFGYNERSVKEYYTNPDFRYLEAEVTDFETRAIKSLLDMGKDVIIDATHLRLFFIEGIKKRFPYCTIYYHLIDTPLHICIEQDSKRDRVVAPEIITRHYNDLQELKKVFDFKPYIPALEVFL